jgi:hypothetical protein
MPDPPDGGRDIDAEELTVLVGGPDAELAAPTPELAHC